MKNFTLTLLLLSIFFTSPLSADEFKAGAAAVDITPQKWPVSVVGSFKDRLATKAWDKLHARALVLDNGTTRIAIVIVDNCLISRSVLDDAKRRAFQATKIPTEKMLIAATHTHSAPPSCESEFTHPTKEYQEILKKGIAEAIKQAADHLEPAEIGWGQIDLPEHVSCRRWYMKPGGILTDPFGNNKDIVRTNPPRGSVILDRPAGPIDPQVSFISIRARDGRPIGLLANYSLHYVGGVSPGGVSADYFGEFARQIQQRIAPQQKKGKPVFVGFLSNGTSGDINNYNFVKPRKRKKPFEQIKYVASSVADAVYKKYLKTKHYSSGKLSMVQTELELKNQKPTAAEITQAKQFLAEPDEKKLPRLAKFYANCTLHFAKLPETNKLILQAIRIGDIAITSNPCEMFAEIGLDIKSQSTFKQTFNIELANGWNRYLPTPQQYRLGGYETWRGSSMLEKEASVKITEQLVKLLKRVKQD